MKPQSEADLAEMVASATGQLRIRGGGTRAIGTIGAAQVLETTGLNGVTLYEPGALTIVAKAGTPLATVEAALAHEGQRLAFEPMDHRALLGTKGQPTIGGVVAANVSGPRRIQAGACRDFCLGVRFVDGRGTVLSNGGRVMKNVTGYDLVKLMAGSWGTLGVMSEVSLKVLPTPETAACILIDGLGDAAAVKVMAQALGSPFEVTGAAHAPKGPSGTAVTLLRIEGFAGSVAYRSKALIEMFAAHDPHVEDDPDTVADLWVWVRDIGPFQNKPGDVWHIACKPSDAPSLTAQLPTSDLLYDWGGGRIWALVAPNTDLRGKLGVFGGHATRIRGGGEAPAFHPEPAALAALSQGLRARFDPRGILNPGLMA